MSIVQTPRDPKRASVPTNSTTITSACKSAKTPPAPLETPQQLKQAADQELARERLLSQKRLQTSWEHIFTKYGRNFEGIADEIDPVTGEIVVDNGHLRSMRDESDHSDDGAKETRPPMHKGTKRKRDSTGNTSKAARRKTISWLEPVKTGCAKCRYKDELDDSTCLHCSGNERNRLRGDAGRMSEPQLAQYKDTRTSVTLAMMSQIQSVLPSDDFILRRPGSQDAVIVELLSKARERGRKRAPHKTPSKQKIPDTPMILPEDTDVLSSSSPEYLASSPLLQRTRCSRRQPPPPSTVKTPLRTLITIPDDEVDELSVVTSPQVITPRVYNKSSSSSRQTPTRALKVEHKGSFVSLDEIDELASAVPQGSIPPAATSASKARPTPISKPRKSTSETEKSAFATAPANTIMPVNKPLIRTPKATSTVKLQPSSKAQSAFAPTPNKRPSSFDIWAVPSSPEPDDNSSSETKQSQSVWAPPPPAADPFFNPLWNDSHPDGTPAKFPPRPTELVFQFTTPKAPATACRGNFTTKGNQVHHGLWRRPEGTPRRKPPKGSGSAVKLTPGWTTGGVVTEGKGTGKLLDFVIAWDEVKDKDDKAVKEQQEDRKNNTADEVLEERNSPAKLADINSPTRPEGKTEAPVVSRNADNMQNGDAVPSYTTKTCAMDGSNKQSRLDVAAVENGTSNEKAASDNTNISTDQETTSNKSPAGAISYPTPASSVASPPAINDPTDPRANSANEEPAILSTTVNTLEIVPKTAKLSRLPSAEKKAEKCGDPGWECTKRFCFECLHLEGEEDNLV